MLRSAKVLLILLFAFTTSVLLFYLTNRFAGYSKEFVKAEFKKSEIYDKYLTEWQDGAKKAFLDGKNSKEDLKIVDQFFAELNKDYLEAKINQAIDDSTLYVSGQSQTVPEISFVDLKERMLKKNPDFEELLAELTTTTTESEFDPDSQLSTHEKNRDEMALEENRLSKLFEQDPVVKLKALTSVKQTYINYKIGFYVVIILTMLWIGLLALLSKPNNNRFRWLSAAFGVGLLWNGLIYILVWYAQKSDPFPRILAAILGLDIKTKEFGLKIVELGHNLSAPWFASFYRVQIIGIIILLALTITFLVLAMRSGVTLTPPVKKRK